ncbi:MAG TPA: hypothetical protein VGH35_08100 [Gaiellaceae bacterium]|jgi:hypothetical protein
MKGFRWLGLPAVAALAVLLFALTAGIGAARTAVAPNNTQPPTISGKAQVGELLKADPGTWTGTPAPTFTYQWRICDQNGGACHDIAGATGNEYTLKSGDQGNTIRVQVTGKNTDGTDTATSVPSGVIAAASATPAPTPAPSGNGCPKLAAGASAVAVSDVSAPARLQVDQMQANPSVITAGTKAFTVKFHVSDTCGSAVKGAQVYATGVPYNMLSIPSQQQTDDSGWVTMQFNTLRGFPATPHQGLLVMFVRASKQGDPILAGISTRRLVSFRVNLHG